MPVASPASAEPSLDEHTSLYHRDPHAWSIEQAAALRRRDLQAVDWENVIEEIESVGKTEQRSWSSFCSNAIHHLLKIEHASRATTAQINKWEGEIQHYRDEMASLCVSSSSLYKMTPAMFRASWSKARNAAVRSLASYDVENRVSRNQDTARKARNLSLPRECPYSLHEVTAFRLDTQCDPPSARLHRAASNRSPHRRSSPFTLT